MEGGPRAGPPPAANRRKRGARIAAASLAVLAAGVGAGWWVVRQPVSAGERHLVGTWKYQWDQYPGDLGLV